MEISLKQMEIFHSVVVAGSITKASRLIRLSQPSISQQLAKLEEILDVQLVIRNRTGQISLTPAGEYWFKACKDTFNRMEAILTVHKECFARSNLKLRLGVTPSLRGAFTSKVAQIAHQNDEFVKLELVHGLSSSELLEKLRLHQIDLAVVAYRAIEHEIGSFAINELYDDRLLWAVPATIDEATIRRALLAKTTENHPAPALLQYVEIDSSLASRDFSDDWYYNTLPSAVPTIKAPTFTSSLEIVASGFGTCHVPLTLLPGIDREVLNKVNLYLLPTLKFPTAVVMRKHLLTHPTFSRFYNKLTEYCRNEYGPQMAEFPVKHFDDLFVDEKERPA